MAVCKNCGKKGLFIKLNSEGLCKKCANTAVIFTFSASFRSYDVPVYQHSSGELQPTSIESWNGFVSPSGGFVDFTIYQVKGKNPDTKRINTKRVEAFSEEEAVDYVKSKFGLNEPFTISILESDPPTDNQIFYAQSLLMKIPEGICKTDMSALIDRIKDEDESPASFKTMRAAFLAKLKISRYHGEKALYRIAMNSSSNQYSAFLKYLKSDDLNEC